MRWCRASGSAERGISESVQWALVWPLVALAVISVVQTALVLQARSALTEAARAAARAHAVVGARPADALTAARAVVARSGVRDLRVAVREDAGLVRVEATGQAPSIVADLVAPRLSAHAVEPREEP